MDDIEDKGIDRHLAYVRLKAAYAALSKLGRAS